MQLEVAQHHGRAEQHGEGVHDALARDVRRHVPRALIEGDSDGSDLRACSTDCRQKHTDK